MSRKLIVAALLAATAALAATPTLAATWHHPAATRYNDEWRAETVNDPTQYMVENSIPVEAHQTPGITASATPMPAASSAYAYAPAAAYRQRSAFGSDPTMYAIRNSIPEANPHVPGIGARS
ncbi:MAG: hypothetical protein JSR61_01755 [Proteobacteria bacterium]|nr:hypothetical protein [Pseudomonadota bacterium]